MTLSASGPAAPCGAQTHAAVLVQSQSFKVDVEERLVRHPADPTIDHEYRQFT